MTDIPDTGALERIAAEAVELASKATPGPWESLRSCPHIPEHDCGFCSVYATGGPAHNCIREAICDNPPGRHDAGNDMALIAHAGTNYGELAAQFLAALARLRELEEWKRRHELDDMDAYDAAKEG